LGALLMPTGSVAHLHSRNVSNGGLLDRATLADWMAQPQQACHQPPNGTGDRFRRHS